MHRTQIYLSEQQQTSLAELARSRGTTSSALIRDAIDDYLAAQLSAPGRLARLRAFGWRVAARPDDEDDAAQVVEELRQADASRLDSIA